MVHEPEAAPNAMVMADSDGRIVLVNAQAEKLFGYPRAELVGNSIDMLVPALGQSAFGAPIRTSMQSLAPIRSSWRSQATRRSRNPPQRLRGASRSAEGILPLPGLRPASVSEREKDVKMR